MDSKKTIRAKVIEEIINRQLSAYIEKHGEEPGPEHPVFFDLDGDTPIDYSRENLRQHLLESAIKAGANPGQVQLHFDLGPTEGKA